MESKSCFSKFLIEAPEKYREEFEREIYHRHIDTILILAVIIFLFEAAASLIIYKFSSSITYTLWVSCLMVIYISIYFKLNRAKPRVITKGYVILENCVIIIILIMGIYISFADPYMKIVIYVIIILILAELFCLKPIISVSIYSASGVIMVLTNVLIKEQDVLRTVNNIINLTFVTIMAIVVSNIAYRNRLKDFLNKKQIEEKTEELIRTQIQLVNSEKMAALGQLVAGIAHEINTPLGAIQASIANINSYLEHALLKFPELFIMLTSEKQVIFFKLLERCMDKNIAISSKEERKLRKSLTEELEQNGVEDSDSIADTLVDMGIYDNVEPYMLLLKDEQRQFLLQMAFNLSGLQRNSKNINMAVERASKMVYALKSYARYDQSGELVEADIITGLETVLTIYHNQIKQNTEVVRNYGTIPHIMCYPDELNQVWTNLIHNALQAMEYKGVLEIEVSADEKYVDVKITDSGKGIPQDIKAKIFEPFFTTKRQGEGTGLGLDIVKKIITKHKGEINVESVPGRTTFGIRLPIGG